MNKKMISIMMASILCFSWCGIQADAKVSTPIVKTDQKDIKQETTKEKPISKYHVKSKYLKNPDLIKAAADQCAAFWIKAYDTEDGGFYTYVNRDGSIDSSKTYKSAFIQSRDAYGLIRAYQLTGKKEYLGYARKALDFMYENAWDKENGGWHHMLNKDGTPSKEVIEGMDWNSMKFPFNEFYCMLGISAMYDVTKNEKDLEWLEKSYAVLDKKLWDSRPGYEGYYDAANKDWSSPSNKCIGTAMDAITTHAMTMCLDDINPIYKDRLLKIADNIIRVSKSMDGREFGMTTFYDSDWKTAKEQPNQTSGDFLKPAWCLAMTYLVNQNPVYKEGAQKFIDQILNSGAYDSINGGPYTSIDSKTGESADKKKCWWILEQGVTAGLTNYYISNDEKSLKMADESLEFFMNHMYDKKYGEVYSDTDENGENPVEMKGHMWKGGYHSLELFYYTYLYGNLMLNNKPVSLYYSIEPVEKTREITLTPTGLGKNTLTIKSIKLDGKDYKAFDRVSRTVKIPANTGGEFKVIFEPIITK